MIYLQKINKNKLMTMEHKSLYKTIMLTKFNFCS